ncbi:MAG: hypothetical protein ACTHL3_00895 [Candidatus Nitrosocosmicus sp.]
MDGNIVWIKENNLKEEMTISESAKFSDDFMNYLNGNKISKK